MESQTPSILPAPIVPPIGTNPPITPEMRPPIVRPVPPIGTNPPIPPEMRPPVRPPIIRPTGGNPSNPPVLPGESVNCPSGYRHVTVGYGVDFASIVERYNVSYNALAAANPTKNPLNVYPGQQYCVPPSGSRSVCPGNRTYTMGANETLRSLPGRLNADTYAIFRANPGMQPGDFRPGQIICRP